MDRRKTYRVYDDIPAVEQNYVASVAGDDTVPTVREIAEFLDEYDEWELNRYAPNPFKQID